MAGAKGNSARQVRLQIMLRSDELAAVDEWRFAMRMPSRAAAIRELLRRGLAGNKTNQRSKAKSD
jgi:metal-responsive CopG/Arc/MetJ family transcriptional regulator